MKLFINHLDTKIVESKLQHLKDIEFSLFIDSVPEDNDSLSSINILVLQEPNEYFGLHDWAIQNQNYFSCILTWGQNVLDKCNNALLFPFGMSFLWEMPEFYEKITFDQKQFKSFFVCGAKQITEGHKFRHSVYSKNNEITIPHNWIYSCPVEEKNENFKNSMFHVAIENSVNQNYFTEKIIDAFLTKTIPIYRGCPNIEEFFDKKGIITFSNEKELVNILNSLTEEDYWNKREYIEYNYQMANYWKDYYTRLISLLKEIIKLNNIL
jgi:hypothetical protein